jgi:4-amino-4-deoxy-L-arabinose transferase-like glycosyltransferase
VTRRVDVPLILILLFATALRVIHITSPIAEAHRWRQTFNADVARQFLQISFDIFHPRVNWGGADGVVAMEFPLVPAMIAGLFAMTGERPAVARTLVVAFSVATCILLYLLGRDLAGRGAGRAAAFVFAASPSAIFFGQAVMVDVPMLFFSAGALLGYLRYLETNSRQALILGGTALALAGLVKLPNILILGPILYLGWAVQGWKAFRDRAFIASVVIALALIAAWYWHADVIFHRTGLGVAAFHAAGTYGPEVSIAAGPMSPVSSWSTAARVMDPDFYWRMWARLWDLHLTPTGLALAIVGIALAFRSFRQSMLVVWLAAVVAFIIATAEGNYFHDYHQLPILLPAALLAGLAAAPAFDLFGGSLGSSLKTGAGRLLIAGSVAVAVGLVAIMSFQRSDVINTHFRPLALDRDRMNAGAAISRATPQEALIVVIEYTEYGNNSPTLLYYANRRGWSLDLNSITDHGLVQLRRQGARYFATTIWPELQAKHPEVADFLMALGPQPLEGAPGGTMLFRLR